MPLYIKTGPAWSSLGRVVIRLSKLTDYGIVVMAHFAQNGPDSTLSAKEIAQKSGLPLPTVSKVLKRLSRFELVKSHRGVNGGYRICRLPESISVSEMIDALEGPVLMTECSDAGGVCEYEAQCPAKSPWQKINRVVRTALSDLSLADMASTIDSPRREFFKNVLK